jgi:hypothetical protein
MLVNTKGGSSVGCTPFLYQCGDNTVWLRVFIGWVEQSETQQTLVNVGFPSVNPTYIIIYFGLNRKVLNVEMSN